MKRLLAMVFLLCLLSNVTFADISEAENTLFSDLITFKSIMMKSVSDQLSSATDLTTTNNNRAVLAALLSLEFANQRPDLKINYNQPIFVGKSGNMASVMFGTEMGYVMVVFKMHPLSTSYGISSIINATMAKSGLLMVSDNVWDVPINLYTEKLAILINQL